MAGRVNLTNNSVIDIGLIQTIAEAVNDHDERLVQLSSNATSGAVDNIFDFSRDIIAFGILNLSLTAGEGHTTVTMPYTFGGVPVVTATPSLYADNSNAWAIAISNITTHTFEVRVERNATGATGTGSIIIQWIAIGVR